ncbi:MAG: hypothetical protein ABGY71_03505 [bacterium]|jgi:hypothetical protein|nr:hypothetical protein [Planctomycetota bacterium]HIL53009.1 hypothetical protein [Planctomycetota bacterium]
MQTRSNRGRQCIVVAGLVLAFVGSSSARAPEQTDKLGDEEELTEPKRLKAWPQVTKRDVKFELKRLVLARTEEMGLQARAALIEIGVGAVPYLVPKLGRERNEDASARLESVLDELTNARHTRLLAEYFDDKSLVTRKWSLRRVAWFPDAGVRSAAENALVAASTRKRNLDSDEIFAAALCCASSGSFEGFDTVAKRAAKDWGKLGPAIHTAFAALRSAEGTKRVAKLLAATKRKTKVAGLRLIAACGEKESAKHLVLPFLDENDNSLRVAAINALRGIVDGDPPLNKLSVFEAIERANKWKARL